MDTAVTILRELWRKRIIVALFAVISIAVGCLLAYRPGFPPQSRKYEIGTATARILVDTPASQVVEVSPEGSETLGARASLLANLMAEGEVKEEIARQAGLDPEQLLATAPAAIEPLTVTEADLRNPRANVVKITVLTNDAGEQLPIIDVETQAVDAKRAAALANAALAGLGDYLDSKAAVERVPDARRLSVRPLGEAVARDVTRGPGRVVALAATICLFTALCGALVLLSTLARGWRAASQLDDADFDLGDPRLGPPLFDDAEGELSATTAAWSGKS